MRPRNLRHILLGIAGVAMIVSPVQRAACSQAAPPVWKTDSALVFLHRAANLVAPENTIPAFEAAVKQGADGVETDIRRTRDGVLVIYHDDWVMLQRGPTGKIEEMTLAETQRLDVGVRFGPRWRGTHLPLFEDVLRFVKANNLRIYLDIKTPGIYDEVMRIVKNSGYLPLVHATGGQVPLEHYTLPIPWITGWNYTEGGEEDPKRMEAVLARAPKGVYGIMCDDARSIVHALGRHPERRSFVPFVSTMQARLRSLRTLPTAADPLNRPSAHIMRDLYDVDPKRRRAACRALSDKPAPPMLDVLLGLAERDPDYAVRQDACWTLGSLRDDRAVPTLLRIALTPYDPKVGAQTEYRDVFLKIAAGCALARLNSAAGRVALKTLMDSPAEFDRATASAGLGPFGTEKDLPTLATFVDARKANSGFAADFVIGYAGRFGMKALPLYITALSRDDIAKPAVFGLAALGPKALPTLRKVAADLTQPDVVRHRAALAIEWMSLKRGED